MSLIPSTSTPTVAEVEKCGALLLEWLHDVVRVGRGLSHS
jgi:hypothetical protein